MQFSRIDVLLLAGGLGTRLKSILPDGLPKTMADINGESFIDILVRSLWARGFKRLIVAGGYGWEILGDHLARQYVGNGGEGISLCIESRQLGTAGAILNASRCIASDPFMVVNADTYCDVDFEAMLAYHKATNSIITVACDAEFRHVGTFAASRRFIDLIPKVDGKVDMAEVFTLLGQRHEPVGWFVTDAPFYDIGDEKGLETFRAYWPSKREKCADTLA